MQPKGYRWILLVLAVLVFSMAAGKGETAFTVRHAAAKTSTTDTESRLSAEHLHLSAFILNGSVVSLQARQQVSDLFPACFSGNVSPAGQAGRLALSVYSSRVSLAYKDKQSLLLFPFHFFT